MLSINCERESLKHKKDNKFEHPAEREADSYSL